MNTLSKLLSRRQASPTRPKQKLKEEIRQLQLELMRIQQGVWHCKGRAILVFEGFDAAGKGGMIRTLTEQLDPRGVIVHPIGPPTPDEQGKHWLYRFWSKIPPAGSIAIFDRSWYGRVLVEKVDGLASPKRIGEAYREILEFEKMLARDGIVLMKFFLGISREEQLKRFRERLLDPYKYWKLNESDIRARKHWPDYVNAVDKLLERTSTKELPWHLVPADHKTNARLEVLRVVTLQLASFGEWMESKAAKLGRRSFKEELKRLGREDHSLD